jgi:hypothetical protein
MAYYPVTNYLYIYVVYVPFCTAQCYTVLYVDGGYIICMLGMDLFRVYTHASRARASSGGGAVRARSRVFSCAGSACAGPQMRWRSGGPAHTAQGRWPAAGAQKRCTQLCSMIAWPKTLRWNLCGLATRSEGAAPPDEPPPCCARSF